MTIYGTPGGTPLNTTPFQGTAPGNAVQATISPVNPGVGLFPPNSNNSAGDSPLAAASRAALPLNALLTNFGQKHHPTAGRTVTDCIEDVDQSGTGTAYTANGGSAQAEISGGNSLGAGGQNQTPSPGSGETAILPQNAPATLPAFNNPNQYGG